MDRSREASGQRRGLLQTGRDPIRTMETGEAAVTIETGEAAVTMETVEAAVV